jgi:hypothetical protein
VENHKSEHHHCDEHRVERVQAVGEGSHAALEDVSGRSVEVLVTIKFVPQNFLSFERSDCGQAFQSCVQVTNHRTSCYRNGRISVDTINQKLETY